MDFIKEDILSDELVPVLLGLSPEAIETAHRIYRQYGVLSHVFCNRVPLANRLTLCMKYHVIPESTNERLMMEALFDFSNQLSNQDVILYLIPCTETYVTLVWNEREALERKFVIAEKAEMHRVWFGEEIQTEGDAT